MIVEPGFRTRTARFLLYTHPDTMSFNGSVETEAPCGYKGVALGISESDSEQHAPDFIYSVYATRRTCHIWRP